MCDSIGHDKGMEDDEVGVAMTCRDGQVSKCVTALHISLPSLPLLSWPTEWSILASSACRVVKSIKSKPLQQVTLLGQRQQLGNYNITIIIIVTSIHSLHRHITLYIWLKLKRAT